MRTLEPNGYGNSVPCGRDPPSEREMGLSRRERERHKRVRRRTASRARKNPAPAFRGTGQVRGAVEAFRRLAPPKMRSEKSGERE